MCLIWVYIVRVLQLVFRRYFGLPLVLKRSVIDILLETDREKAAWRESQGIDPHVNNCPRIQQGFWSYIGMCRDKLEQFRYRHN